MIQQVFNIHHEEVPTDCLIIELGTNQVTFTSISAKGVFGKNIEMYKVDNTHSFDEQINNIIQASTIAHLAYNEVHIVWQNHLAQCIPLAHANEALINATYQILGNEMYKCKALCCSNKNITLPYLIKQEQWETLNNLFPNATHQHKYLPIIDHFCNYTSHNELNILVLFLQNHFIITAQKNKQLQFINSIAYTSSTEVVYHILNAAQQLDTPISKTSVVLSGLIDGDSALYKEIYQYIPCIDVDKSEKAQFLKADFSEYPSHFFVPFFKYV